MKSVVSLAILVATLLLFTNMAFAPPQCDQEVCYVVTTTFPDATTSEVNWRVCLNNNGTGILCEYGEDCMTLYEFQGGPALFTTSLFPLGAGSSNAWIVRGEDLSYFINYFAGFYIAGVAADYEGGRSTIRGMKAPCEHVVPSDERYKKEIQPLGSSLDNVMQLRGVSYSWRTDEYKGKGFKEGRQIGLIAQEVERIYPELVTTDGNGYKAIFYNKLVPVLIEAVKEQQKEIKEKDVRIERLERSLEIMEKRIAAIESPTRTLVLK